MLGDSRTQMTWIELSLIGQSLPTLVMHSSVSEPQQVYKIPT